MAERAMPSFTKSPPELVERFRSVLAAYPDAHQKPMFGFPAAFVGGNMATGLFRDEWVVRLPDAEIDAAKAAGAGPFEPMPGKPMKGYARLPADVVADEARLDAWIRRAIALGRSLPPK